MQVGIAVLVRDEQVEFQFHGRRPEDPRSLVAHAQHGRQHALLMGRLTYRGELAISFKRESRPRSRLMMPPSPWPPTADGGRQGWLVWRGASPW